MVTAGVTYGGIIRLWPGIVLDAAFGSAAYQKVWRENSYHALEVMTHYQWQDVAIAKFIDL